jgi:DNA invertase Pin-like site-specific DNA recombinase
LKESIDINTSTGKLLFMLMSAMAQFERDVIAERTKEELQSTRAVVGWAEGQKLTKPR